MEYRFPEETPRFVREILDETLSSLHFILRDNVVGIYLYGSLTMSCFNHRSSDIDIILVAKRKLSTEKRRRIIDYLKEVCSKERRIELSIVSQDAIQNPQYPLLVDLHFEYWGDIFENEKDSEILSNLYTTSKRGFCVWGKPIGDVFSGIPAQYHLRSVIDDLINTRERLHQKPEHVGYDVTMYWILASCRILAFIREERVLSKLEGGEWGLSSLPKRYHGLIRQALSCYRGKRKDCTWKHQELEAFADYMTNIILNESKL